MARLGRPAVPPSTVAALLMAGMGLTPMQAASFSASGSASSGPAKAERVADDPLVVARKHASELARATGQKVPVEELTTETTKVWAKPDGKLESVIASGPVRIKRNGRWSEAD